MKNVKNHLACRLKRARLNLKWEAIVRILPFLVAINTIKWVEARRLIGIFDSRPEPRKRLLAAILLRLERVKLAFQALVLPSEIFCLDVVNLGLELLVLLLKSAKAALMMSLCRQLAFQLSIFFLQ